MPRPCAQAIIGTISASLTPLSATMLILTLSPAFCAASIPAITLSRSPRRVIALNFSRSRVSRETLMRRTPQLASSSACAASCEPLVVSVSSSRSPDARWRDRSLNRLMMLRRTSGSPPVILSLRVPRATKVLQRRSSSSSVSRSRLGQESHVLRHAIDAAEVAAVGHRDADIADPPAERIDQRRLCAREARRGPKLGARAVHWRNIGWIRRAGNG